MSSSLSNGVLFSLRYAGSVGYYAAMLHFGSVVVDASEHYARDHRYLNRMEISTVNRRQSLSLPLQKPHRDMAVDSIVLSEHGNWRHNQWGALFSAYGRTPFFDYFADDLHALYVDVQCCSLYSFCRRLHEMIVDFLDLPITTDYVLSSDCSAISGQLHDLRDTKPFLAWESRHVRTVEYYQIWGDRIGFQTQLSILDLLFNEGREAIFTLRRMVGC